MGRKLTLPEDFKDYDFLKIMRKMKHGRNRIRLLAMHHIQLGKSLKDIAKIVQCHWITVQQWLKRFKEDGFDGLYESQRSGAPRKIEKEAEILTQKINKDEVETDDFNTDVEDSTIDRKKKKIYLNYYHKNNKIKKKGLDDTSFGERGDEDILNKKNSPDNIHQENFKLKYYYYFILYL